MLSGGVGFLSRFTEGRPRETESDHGLQENIGTKREWNDEVEMDTKERQLDQEQEAKVAEMTNRPVCQN